MYFCTVDLERLQFLTDHVFRPKDENQWHALLEEAISTEQSQEVVDWLLTKVPLNMSRIQHAISGSNRPGLLRFALVKDRAYFTEKKVIGFVCSVAKARVLQEYGMIPKDILSWPYFAELTNHDIIVYLVNEGFSTKHLLRHLAFEGKLNTMRFLLERTPPPSRIALKNALILACRRQRIDAVKLLLEHGAEVSRLCVTATFRFDSPELFDLLVEHGAHGVDDALALAIRHDSRQLMKRILTDNTIEVQQHHIKQYMARNENEFHEAFQLMAGRFFNPSEQSTDYTDSS